MRTSKFMYGIAILTGMVLAACGHKSGNQDEIEYFPFQTEKNGNWGLISPSGEVLFAEEFKNAPTIAVNGRFLVTNGDGMVEIYTTDKKPKKIGGEYLQAGLFYEDVAPVVEKDKHIQLIDRDGNVKVTLDKIDGKTVKGCTNFTNGIAIVQVEDDYGAIDVDGKVVLAPQYAGIEINFDGRMVALHKKYRDEDWENRTFSIFDRKGKEIATIKASKFTDIRIVKTSYRTSRDQLIGDGLLVAVNKDGRRVEGILGFDGEWVLKPTDKRHEYSEVVGDLLTYRNSDGMGLTNMKGDNLIRAKFYKLEFVDKDLLIGKKSSGDRWELYNLEGEKIGKEDYEEIWLFHGNEDYTFAKIGNGDYVLLDRKGNEKKLEAEVYKIDSGSRGNSYFWSNYQEPVEEIEAPDQIVDDDTIPEVIDETVDYD